MLSSILGTVAAAPLLSLGLAKIARTPRGRLEVGYRLVRRAIACDPNHVAEPCNRLRLAQDRPTAFVQLLATDWHHAQFQLRRTLGAEWAVERLLAGGIVGEWLPLANLRCEAEQGASGQLLDIRA
jgi:hypothetical protein